MARGWTLGSLRSRCFWQTGDQSSNSWFRTKSESRITCALPYPMFMGLFIHNSVTRLSPLVARTGKLEFKQVQSEMRHDDCNVSNIDQKLKIGESTLSIQVIKSRWFCIKTELHGSTLAQSIILHNVQSAYCTTVIHLCLRLGMQCWVEKVPEHTWHCMIVGFEAKYF